jgi:hypothetical protein
MTYRCEGFWWVRLRARVGDGVGTWRPLWSFGDSLMTHDPHDGGEFAAMKEDVCEWGPFLGKGWA